MPPGGGIHTIKIRARLAQDLVGLPKLAVLAFQSLQLCRHIRGNTGAHTTVALGLLHPLMQRLRRAADLGGDRRDRRPARGMLAFVIQNHSHRAGADLGRELVDRLACHGSTFSGVGASDQPGAVHTDAGRSYIEACKRIIEQVNEAEQEASGEYRTPTGDLTVTSPWGLGHLHLLPLSCEFLNVLP